MPNDIPGLFFWTERIPFKDLVVDITVATTPAGLCWVDFGALEEAERRLRTWAARWFPKAELSRIHEPNRDALRQIRAYFAGDLKTFTLPLHQVGTPFQLRVWEELLRIPYGETCSYGEMAKRVDNPKGQRAVGMANNKNPIGIVVPCHRVIGKNGDLTGYAGGLHYKQRLLELEGSLAGSEDKR